MTTNRQIRMGWDSRLMSSGDAARRLGMSTRSVRNLLPDDVRMVGREVYYPSSAVSELKAKLASKRCPWCGKQALPSKHNVTCGGPVCSKRQRQTAVRGKQPLTREQLSSISMSPDAISRKRIADGMRRELAKGEVIGTAVLNVAVAQKESPASVISVWKSVNL
jgi:hypothetical protein